MYIFSYFFQKGHFQGSSKKGHIDKKLWGADDPSVSRVNAELKFHYMFGFIEFLFLRILELFTHEVCIFLKK